MPCLPDDAPWRRPSNPFLMKNPMKQHKFALLLTLSALAAMAATEARAACTSPAGATCNFRKEFIGLLAGTFHGKCTGSGGTASLSADAVASFPTASLDLSTPDTTVGYVSRTLVNRSPGSDTRGIGLYTLNASNQGAGGTWNAAGEMEQFMLRTVECRKQKDVPSGTIAGPVDIGAKAAALMSGYRGSFPANRCIGKAGANGQTTMLPAQAVSVNGDTVTIGSIARQLNADLVKEHVAIEMAAANPTNHFSYMAEYTDGGTLMVQYSAAKGVEMITSSKAGASISCLPAN